MSRLPGCAATAWLVAVGLAGAASSTDPGQDPWRRQVESSLRDAEYVVTFQEHASIRGHPGGLHAANRAQDLRAYFTPLGVDVARRTEGEASWALHLAWPDAFDGGMSAAPPQASGRSVRYERGDRTATFENLERGMVQRLEFPLAAESLEGTLTLGVATGLAASEVPEAPMSPQALAGGEIQFLQDGVVLVRLRLVRALDEQGRDLGARLSLDGDTLRIDWRRSPAGAPQGNDGADPLPPSTLPDDLPLPDPAGLSPTSRARVELLLTGPGAAPESIEISSTPIWTVRGGQDGCRFGTLVTSAGDVNGDNYGDVVITAPSFDNGQMDEGKVFVYHGGPGGLGLTAAWSAEGNQAAADFGRSAAAAGDVNGDGYGDLIVGAPGYQRVFAYLGSPAGLATVAAWFVDSNQAGAAMGASVASAGDVNGDGRDDVIVGAPAYDNGQTNEGIARAYLGTPSGLSAAPVWSAEGNQANASFGASVAGAGDVDGDGYDDLIVGASRYDLPTTDEGLVLLYRGGAAGPVSTSSWNAQGDSFNAQLGFSVGAAGDVNGDGYADVIVGAPGYQSSTGQARVHLGSANGLDFVASWVRNGGGSGQQFGAKVAGAGDLNGDGFADLVITAATLFGQAAAYLSRGGAIETVPVWTANPPAGYFGLSAGGAGDVDGDGFSDLLVGISGGPGNTNNDGAASLYRGGATAPSFVPAWEAGGAQTGASLGVSLASAGDVNGDGFGDVIVGAYLFDNGEVDEGQARVHLGSATGLQAGAAWSAEGDQAGARFGYSVAGAGDVNGDGYSDVVVGAYFASDGEASEGLARVYPGSAAGIAAAPSWTLEGNQAGAGFGIAVASAGDVNADGFSDVLVGAHLHDNGETDEGKAYLFLGSLAGLAIVPAWSVEGDQAGARAGFSLGTAGDVNGDGFSDVVVGAYLKDNGETDEGSAAIYRGGVDGLEPQPVWSAEGNQPGANFGYAVATAGDLDGDGYSDVAIGALRKDVANADDGTVEIFYGGPGGPSVTAGDILSGDQSSGWFGSAVAAVGDVNGDGFGDLLVGARLRDQSLPDEGRVTLFLGASYGIDPIAAWAVDGGQSSAFLGFAVAGAGDVNGDGFGDLLVGALGFDAAATNEGSASVFYGNGGAGMVRVPRQLRPDGSPLAPLAILSADLSLRLETRACGFAGRVLARLEWELKPLGVPFDGLGSEQATGTVVVGAPGAACAAATGLAQGLSPGYLYRWRMRTVTAASGRSLSPWFSPAFNSPGETDLRSPGCADADGDGYVAYPTPGCPLGSLADCFDLDARVYPGAPEECDGIANNCDAPAWPDIPADERDADADGFALCDGDCDDGSAASFPGNPEICDGRDNNCDGAADEGLVGSVDVCNGLDDNCDGTADEGNPGGGLSCTTGQQGICAPGITACTQGHLVCTPLQVPLPEVCNNLDDDCNGTVDAIPTSCGAGACQRTGICLGGVDQCVPGTPGAAEICNRIDDDCNGTADEGNPGGGLSCTTGQQGICAPGMTVCTQGELVCIRLQGPRPEVCNNLDDDCNGIVDAIQTSCGVGGCQRTGSCLGGVDQCVPGTPGAVEICNRIDDDCDGSLPFDELDADQDGYPTCLGDCDDGNPLRSPGRSEACDAIDNDCNGVVDSFAVACGCNSVGFCEAGVITCDPSGLPKPEECNGIDDDCDGILPPEEADTDGDTWLVCAGDCDPTDGGTYPGALETHDFSDNQCPGSEGAGSVDEISGQTGFPFVADLNIYCWPAQPGAAEYEAARSAAPDRGLGCSSLRVSNTCWSDPVQPPSGGVFYYLVRAVAPGMGSFGQDSLGSERRGWCGGEGSCSDAVDGDADGLVDCADRLDCFGVGGCTSATFTFHDTVANDVPANALEAFFASVPAAAGDYMRLSLTEGADAVPFEWCSDRAVFHRTRYLGLASWSGNAANTDPSQIWHRTGSDPWVGPFADETQSLYGLECIAPHAWCPQVGLGDRGIVVDPGHNGECEAWDFIYGCGGRAFTLTLTLGVDRLSACGF